VRVRGGPSLRSQSGQGGTSQHACTGGTCMARMQLMHGAPPTRCAAGVYMHASPCKCNHCSSAWLPCWHLCTRCPWGCFSPLYFLPQRLYAVKGLSEAKAEKMVEAARKITNCGEWQTGTDCLLRVRQRGLATAAGGVKGNNRACMACWCPVCVHTVAAHNPVPCWLCRLDKHNYPCSASARSCASRAAPQRSTRCWAAAWQRQSVLLRCMESLGVWFQAWEGPGRIDWGSASFNLVGRTHRTWRLSQLSQRWRRRLPCAALSHAPLAEEVCALPAAPPTNTQDRQDPAVPHAVRHDAAAYR
jgi:hypothetical protein